MRTLKLQMQVSLDGFVAGPQGEMDWMTWNWSEDIKQYVISITEPVDTILMGRKLAQGFIPHWAAVAADPSNPEYEFGKKMHETTSFVFSKNLTASEWDGVTLLNGELQEEVSRLKEQSGKDMIVYGGASFVSSLINADLIDEFHLFINPTAIGTGLSIFSSLENKCALKLSLSIAFDCGIVLLCYKKC